MTEPENKQPDHNLNLLADTDFVSLMDAEYKSTTDASDELAKQRIWKQIEPRLSMVSKPGSRRFETTKRYYAAAALLLLVTVSLPTIFFDSAIDSERIDSERMKGKDDINDASLYMYKLDSTGALSNPDKQHSVGTTLVFKVHGSQQSVVSLVLSRNGKLSTIGKKFKLAPVGDEQLLSLEGNAYGYMIEPADRILQFCVVAAESNELLNIKLADLDTTWSQLPAKSCGTVSIFDTLN